jgi:hypothetical protein
MECANNANNEGLQSRHKPTMILTVFRRVKLDKKKRHTHDNQATEGIFVFDRVHSISCSTSLNWIF